MQLSPFLFRGAIVAGALLSTPVVAHAGPPWIAVELPANPLNETTRGAYLLVRTYRHADPISAPLTGQAIGTVDGQRQAVTLAFERTSIPGVYAVRRTWPEQGAWVLAIHLGEGAPGGASALVGIAADGRVRSVEVPTSGSGDDRWPRPASRQDIERTLSSVASLAAAPAEAPDRRAGIGALLLLPVGAGIGFALRRR